MKGGQVHAIREDLALSPREAFRSEFRTDGTLRTGRRRLIG
jgi:hypothetical protein